MSYGADDLTPLLTPPPSEAVRYGQGVVTEWDPETFENEIEWRGVRLRNLPVLSGIEALTYQPGDVVGLMGWAPGKGAGSWWIIGRLVIPGAGNAERAIEWMTGELGRAVSAAVFAERIRTDVVSGTGSTSSTSFVSLFSGRPVVEDVEVTEAGRAIVLLSAQVSPEDNNGAWMGVNISGATSVSPSFGHALSLSSGSSGTFVFARMSRAHVFNLNPGTHTFQARYRASNSSDPAFFTDPSIIVIAF